MKNYNDCSCLLLSDKMALTYSRNTNSYDIFTRKYSHDLQVTIQDQNLENQIGVDLASSNIILITNKDELLMYSSITFELLKKIKVPMLGGVSKTIVSLCKSDDE